ncbi:hypothetical protein ABT294_50615 [Nonomuraea sp. NPDC000554]|uniref:hypothetical protein n=1 Tax=Nonomuraea sp. NPDC000554 TaxID=3154259 RepID=UPI003325CA20
MYCYQAAKRRVGTCADCGHQGMTPGRNDAGQPTCLSCSHIPLDLTCHQCGIEAWLAKKNTCWACELKTLITSLLAGPDSVVRPELIPLATALAGMQRPNSGVTWIRTNPKVATLLSSLGNGDLPLNHAAFDALPKSQTVEYVRELLIEHAVLPFRDRYVAGYERWLATKLADLQDIEQRQVIEQFGRWHHLRRLRAQAAKAPVTQNAFLHAKQSTTVATSFLHWLQERGRHIWACSQHDIDSWLSAGPTTRQQIDSFLCWAVRQRLIKGIKIPTRNYRGSPHIEEGRRLDLLRMLLLHETMPADHRIAGCLILLFGQPIQRIARMRMDHVKVTAESVELRLSREWIPVPEPFATLLRAYLGNRPHMNTAANPDSPWLFPGGMPRQPITPQMIATRLSREGLPPLAARSGTWLQLVREAPPSVLAQALGIHPITAMRHAKLAGADFLSYPRPGDSIVDG